MGSWTRAWLLCAIFRRCDSRVRTHWFRSPEWSPARRQSSRLFAWIDTAWLRSGRIYSHRTVLLLCWVLYPLTGPQRILWSVAQCPFLASNRTECFWTKPWPVFTARFQPQVSDDWSLHSLWMAHVYQLLRGLQLQPQYSSAAFPCLMPSHRHHLLSASHSLRCCRFESQIFRVLWSQKCAQEESSRLNFQRMTSSHRFAKESPRSFRR